METEVDVDLVISTIYLELEDIPSIVVSPMMSKADLQQVESQIERTRRKKETQPTIC